MKIKIQLKNVDRTFRELRKDQEIEIETQSDIQVARLMQDLVDETPIDTGEARASWGMNKLNKDYIIRNTAEHIKYLNEGSSKQAPARFIESVALRYGTPKGAILTEDGDVF